MTLTNQELNKIMLDVYLQNEEMAGECLLAAIGSSTEDNSGPQSLIQMLAQCEVRGINPAKALEKAWKKQERLLEYFSTSGKLPGGRWNK